MSSAVQCLQYTNLQGRNKHSLTGSDQHCMVVDLGCMVVDQGCMVVDQDCMVVN